MRRSVLHVHWAFPPTTGGVESHLWDLARQQAERGRRVTVLTGEAEPVRTPGYEIVSTPLLDLETARAGARRPGEHATAVFTLLRTLVEQDRASVIHGHNLHHFSPAPALAVERIRNEFGIPAHHTFHETWPDVLASTPVYRSWEGAYATSRFIQDQCAELIGFRPEVLPLGVDTDLFRPQRAVLEGGARPMLFHPARLLPWKGVHISVEALRRLADRGIDAELVLTDTQRIADWDHALPEYRRQVLDLIEKLGVADRIRFAHAAFADMPTLYNQADIVLYPTIQGEPYGLVPLEAMSCGRPVVASRCGGIVETVEHDVSGHLVCPGDAKELADHIAMLLADPPLARMMGKAGRRRAENEFSARNYVVELEQRYEGRL